MNNKQKLIETEQAVSKLIGILVNIRHETDYLPDTYYDWIDKVINETEEYAFNYSNEQYSLHPSLITREGYTSPNNENQGRNT